MNKRIAIDGTSALAQGGGIGRFTRGLLQGLGATDTETPYTIVYTKDANSAPRPALPANYRWRSLGMTQKQAIWLWHRLRLPVPIELWIGNVDLFHSPDYTLPPTVRARSIVTVHDLSFEALTDVHAPTLRAYLQRAVPYSVARATHVFADSESTRDEMIRYYGTAPEKISVVYPGVEPRFRPFDMASETDRATLESLRQQFDLRRPFLLSVGTLEPRKNLRTLLRAFARLRQRDHSDIDLIIAGGGGWLGEREALEALVRELGLTSEVRFIGFVADEQLPALINLSDALVYPSRYEGFGLPVLEALACGVPVVTARNTSLPEAGGNAAHYIDDAYDHDALAMELATVLDAPHERARMIHRGLTHAASFTWDATARRVLDLYRRILSTP